MRSSSGRGKFGIFDTFANEGGRNAHLTGEVCEIVGRARKRIVRDSPADRKSGDPCNHTFKELGGSNANRKSVLIAVFVTATHE